jgi:hypothetical protein
MPLTNHHLDANTPPQTTGCCGGDGPTGTDACCALDAEVKTSGGSGCNCNCSCGNPTDAQSVATTAS